MHEDIEVTPLTLSSHTLYDITLDSIGEKRQDFKLDLPS